MLGHIIAPIVVKNGQTLADAVNSSAFKFVMFVLRVLAANDDRIIDEFRSIFPTAPDKVYAKSGSKSWKDWAGSPQTK